MGSIGHGYGQTTPFFGTNGWPRPFLGEAGDGVWYVVGLWADCSWMKYAGPYSSREEAVVRLAVDGLVPAAEPQPEYRPMVTGWRFEALEEAG